MTSHVSEWKLICGYIVLNTLKAWQAYRTLLQSRISTSMAKVTRASLHTNSAILEARLLLQSLVPPTLVIMNAFHICKKTKFLVQAVHSNWCYKLIISMLSTLWQLHFRRVGVMLKFGLVAAENVEWTMTPAVKCVAWQQKAMLPCRCPTSKKSKGNNKLSLLIYLITRWQQVKSSVDFSLKLIVLIITLNHEIVKAVEENTWPYYVSAFVRQ